MQKKISKLLYFTVCFAFFVFATLFVSDLLVEQLLNGFSYANEIFSLNYVENTGAAFSILQDSRELLIILSVAAICGIIAYILKHISTISMKTIFVLAMLGAGIGGNLHERIAYGYVRDYVQFNNFNFPVFNISDILINIGVVLLIIFIIFKKK